MVDIDKITDITEKFIYGTDIFVVEIKCSPTNSIEITLDSDSSVSIDKCVALSREINSSLDREIEDFELTVGSAGIGQPLKHPRQYIKTVGKTVEVLLENGIKYEGKLISSNDMEIEIQFQEKQMVEGKKRKQIVEVCKTINKNDIKTTKLLINFK